MLTLLLWFVLVLGVYVIAIEPVLMRVRREKVVVSEGAGKKILFLSDLHMTWFRFTWIEAAQWNVIAKALGEGGFEVILLGGDFLDHTAGDLQRTRVLKFLAFLHSFNLPVVGVLGNHDHRCLHGYSDEVWEKELREAGLIILRDSIWKGEGFTVFGLDDPERDDVYFALSPSGRRELFAEQAKKMSAHFSAEDSKNGGVGILLSHNPDGLYYANLPKHQLVLSGHTHGGQYLPWRWLTAASHYFPVPRGSFGTWSGRKTVDGRELIVTTGIGSSTVPGRFFMFPEVVVIELIAKN